MLSKPLCLLATLALSALAPASAGAPPPVPVAVFSQDDVQFSETFKLYADGTYQQDETQKKENLYGPRSLYHPFSSEPADLLGKIGSKRICTWRVLDKDGGQPILFKTLAALPKDAVIILTNAMPFGITWERQSPFQSHGTRTLPASAFQAPPLKGPIRPTNN